MTPFMSRNLQLTILVHVTPTTIATLSPSVSISITFPPLIVVILLNIQSFII